MGIQEAFNDPESRVYEFLMFADIVGSTAIKEQSTEAEWTTTLGWFYDKSAWATEQCDGTVVKYLGDGVLIVFDDAAKAINAAILLQEAIGLANHDHVVAANCSIGIAAGEVIRFSTDQGTDYVGSVVDCAARLSSVASAQAVFADASTVTSAQMHLVRSELGVALHRTVAEYAGSVQEVSLKGFTKPVTYHEIQWSNQLFGVRSGVVTEAVNSARLSDAKVPTIAVKEAARETNVSDKGAGRITTWKPDQHHGFILDADNEFFYFSSERVVGDLSGLRKGARVHFVPRPSEQAGRNRVAACVLVVGSQVTGRVQRLLLDKGYGFVDVRDAAGNTSSVFWYFGMESPEVNDGEEVDFRVGENGRGPIVIDPDVYDPIDYEAEDASPVELEPEERTAHRWGLRSKVA